MSTRRQNPQQDDTQGISRYGLRKAIHAASEKHPRELRKNSLQNHSRSFEAACPHCRFTFEHHSPRYSEMLSCPACGIRFELKSDLQIDVAQIEHIEKELAKIRQELQQHSFPQPKRREKSFADSPPFHAIEERFSVQDLTDEIASDDEIVAYEPVLSDDAKGYWLADYVYSEKFSCDEKSPTEILRNPMNFKDHKTKKAESNAACSLEEENYSKSFVRNKTNLTTHFFEHYQNHKNQWRKKFLLCGALTGLICVFVLLLLHSRDFSKQADLARKENSRVSEKRESNAVSSNSSTRLSQSKNPATNDNVLSGMISFGDETPNIPPIFNEFFVPENYTPPTREEKESSVSKVTTENADVATVSATRSSPSFDASISAVENFVAQETHSSIVSLEPQLISGQLIPLPPTEREEDEQNFPETPEKQNEKNSAARLIKQNEAESLLHEAYSLIKKNPVRSMLLTLQSIRCFQELGLDVPNNARWALNQSLASQHLGISLNGFYGGIEAMTLSKDGRWFLFADDEGKVWLWDVTKHEHPAGFLLDTIEGGVSQLHMTSDLNWGICVALNGMIRIWNLTLEQPSESPIDIVDLRRRFAYSIVSEDGRWLAAYGKPMRGSQNSANEVYLWNLNEITAKKTLSPPLVLKGHEKPIRALTISKNSQWLASGSEDKTVRVYDLQASAAEQFVLKGHELEVNDIAISPNGRWLATGGRDAILRVWDLQKRPNMNPIALREHDGWISMLVFSNDGRYLATGSYDKTIRLWRIEEGAEKDHLKVERVLTGHESPVKFLQFSNKNNMIVSLGLDREIRLWNLEQGNPSEHSLMFYSPGVPFSRALITNDCRWLILAQPKANLKKQSGLRLWPLQFAETLDCASKFANASFSSAFHNAALVFAGSATTERIPDEQIARINDNSAISLPEIAKQPPQESVAASIQPPTIITSAAPSITPPSMSMTSLAAQPSASSRIQLTIPHRAAFRENGITSENALSGNGYSTLSFR
ncbi:MAG: WD40 repeat domain-containing protein [Planctomycetaceae bacterium]|jgi:WD40 repeat protein|nr:WD40 repeat domain-containing protein [Planctomycetaceae bacterium]